MLYYFLSLGSNIEPEENLWRMLDKLQEHFGNIDISRIEQTEAIGFKSKHYFLNMCTRIRTDLDSSDLKKILIGIEEDLGRDRTQPDCKTSDRPADIDILFSVKVNEKWITDSDIPNEKYVQATFIDLARALDYDFSAFVTGIRKDRSIERNGIIIGDKVKTL